MSHLPERLGELRRHLDHLRKLQPRVESATQLRRDLSLHNDLLFSLLTVCQLIIDIAGELCARNMPEGKLTTSPFKAPARAP